ncbi:MAG: hypothetical protein KDD89_16085, partial [Anaerolineales bacterium]|nr:hypothetical protein [Anaerolineales bacterium]
GWGDLYQFTAQSPLTPTQAPGNQFDVTLGANSTAQALVQITVPEFAPAGFANDLTLQAYSIAEPTIQAIVTDTVTAKATVGTRYVSPAGNDTNNNCRVRDLPCATIERGVNQASTGDAVYIAIGNYTVTEIGVNTTISIRGGWKTDFSEQVDFIEGSTDVSASDSDRHFDISGSTTQPTLERLVLRDGNRTSGGAMQVRNGARVSLSRLIFVENAATRGGALYVTAGATAVVNSSRFLDNQSSTDGGAIFAEGTVELNNTLLVGNTADQFGGAIYSRGTAVVTIWHNTFDNNQAATRGGAIYQSGGSLLLRNSNLTNNQAPDSGAIHRALGSYTADYNNIWNNSAPASNEAPGANSV